MAGNGGNSPSMLAAHNNQHRIKIKKSRDCDKKNEKRKCAQYNTYSNRGTISYGSKDCNM